jgi:hypothetical protein
VVTVAAAWIAGAPEVIGDAKVSDRIRTGDRLDT